MGSWVVILKKSRKDPSNVGETRKFRRSVVISKWIITPKSNGCGKLKKRLKEPISRKILLY